MEILFVILIRCSWIIFNDKNIIYKRNFSCLFYMVNHYCHWDFISDYLNLMKIGQKKIWNNSTKTLIS